MIRHIIKMAVMLGLLMTLFACGQSGSLYLPAPDQQKATAKP